MNVVLYYFFVKPVSLFPLSVLYLLSDFTFWIIYYAIGYRKKVVIGNLKNAFPQKSNQEIQQIGKAFYRHFCDNILESVRLFSISKKEVLERCTIANPEIFKPYVLSRQNIVIVGAHYNNWELAALSSELNIPHHIVGLITPLRNKFWHKKLVESRTRFGVSVVPKNEIDAYMEQHKSDFLAPVFVGDQSPSSAKKKLYWTRFLNQETGVMLGAEKYARQYNYPVLYAYNRKIKRGYYQLVFEVVTNHPLETKPFEITEKHLRLLEAEIIRKPEYWLWSHRRWKLAPDSQL